MSSIPTIALTIGHIACVGLDWAVAYRVEVDVGPCDRAMTKRDFVEHPVYSHKKPRRTLLLLSGFFEFNLYCRFSCD